MARNRPECGMVMGNVRRRKGSVRMGHDDVQRNGCWKGKSLFGDTI